MLKRFKSISMFFICILVVSTILAGCNSNNQSNSDSGANGNDKGEPYELTMAFLTFTNVDDLPAVQEEINKIAQEKVNVKVNLLPIGISAWTQQTNLMLTGNEKLDLIVTSSLFNYGSQAVKGQLVGLDELLASHGQDILEVIPEHMLNATKIEGVTYGVPSVRDWAANYGFLMRKDLVEKHNIDLSQIKTFEDLGPVFKTIQENEPGLTPVVNTGNSTVASRLYAEHFDTFGDFLGVLPFEGDDKFVNMFEHPKYEEAVNLAREWYQAGYIIKDSATSQEAQANIVKAGKGFGYFPTMKPGFETQEKGITGFEMVAAELTKPYMYTTGATSFMMSIARNSENPEKAMEFMNLLYTDENIMNLIANGIEGKHYAVNDEGTISLPEGVTESNYVFGQWQIGNNALTHPWEGNDSNYWDQMMEFNNSAVVSPAFGFTFNPDPVKTEIAAATNVLNQFKLGLESGTLEPAKSLPEFNEKLKAAGLDKIIAEKQKQYDEWKANK